MVRARLILVLGLLGCSTGETPRPVRDFPDAALPDPYGCGIEFCVLPEECNGLDDDQDGEIDEYAAYVPLSKYCHAGCVEGVQVCAHGRWGPCEPVTPYAPETGLFACDGLDNDCDGFVDEEPFVGGDVVFAIDRSGSMIGWIASVILALDSFASGFDSDWRFAIVVFPYRSDDFLLWSDFLLYEDTQDELNRILAAGTTGSQEASWDVLEALGTNTLGLSWRPDAARLIFLITDEAGQSYPRGNSSESQACSTFTHGEMVTSYVNYPDDFDECGVTRSLDQIDGIAYEVRDPCSP